MTAAIAVAAGALGFLVGMVLTGGIKERDGWSIFCSAIIGVDKPEEVCRPLITRTCIRYGEKK